MNWFYLKMQPAQYFDDIRQFSDFLCLNVIDLTKWFFLFLIHHWVLYCEHFDVDNG